MLTRKQLTFNPGSRSDRPRYREHIEDILFNKITPCHYHIMQLYFPHRLEIHYYLKDRYHSSQQGFYSWNCWVEWLDFLVRNGYKHSLTGFLAQLCTIPSLLPLFLFYVVYFAFVHVVSVHVNHVVHVSLINKRKWWWWCERDLASPNLNPDLHLWPWLSLPDELLSLIHTYAKNRGRVSVDTKATVKTDVR